MILILGLCGTVIASTAIGSAEISPFLSAKVLLNQIPLAGKLFSETPGPVKSIILQVRLPRVITGALVGASLGVAGTTIQGIFRNPMAEPYTVGVSAGASLGAVSSIALGLSFFGMYTIPFMSFLFGLGAILLVYNVAKVKGRLPIGVLLLAGIAVSLFLSSIVRMLMYTAGEELHGMVFWVMGGLWARNWTHVFMILPFISVGSGVIYYYSRGLNAMLLGEEQAQQLGHNVEKMKKILLILSALITSAAVSVSGIIGFVGLIIPHIMRILIGSDHRILIPASALGGGIFLVWADAVSRAMLAPIDLPVGIITAMAGGPFFIYLLRREKYSF
ncbi:hypothetical protein AKJ41_00155 [candidate division MSBL1 archaeon SCGC-AAA259O05]|uniref:Iron ABC transporter n=1 Tax=candidate division MSBL1 archaeon SCGC-AAA259O05 TaxID=1698271 RepID=A0A133V5W6_9EURY|nr:hypothetical protein AKJ41_00155 [candidate division MSBL1 archaeon SCGC-AAA259O05]